MKQTLLTLFFALATLGASAQVDNTFIFVDANGNEIADGSTLVCTELHDAGWDIEIASGLYIKNNTLTQAYASLVVNITRLDNGTLSHCFPGNCYRYPSVGEQVRPEVATMEAGAIESLRSEWIPNSAVDKGMCTAEYTIRVMEPTFGTNYNEKAKGATVTVHFCNGVFPANISDAIAISNNRAYNLQGQRVGEDYHGVVIVNGHKIVR